jgi:hypothetical protein
MRDWLSDGSAADAYGLRVHREGLIGFPKKNAKSTGAAARMLYLLTSSTARRGRGLLARVVEGPGADRLQRGAHDGREEPPAARDPRRSDAATRRHDLPGASDGVYKAISADSDVHRGDQPSRRRPPTRSTRTRRAPVRQRPAAMRRARAAAARRADDAGVTFKAKGGKELNLLGDLYQRGAGRRPKYRLRKLHPALAEHGHKAEHSLVVARSREVAPLLLQVVRGPVGAPRGSALLARREPDRVHDERSCRTRPTSSGRAASSTATTATSRRRREALAPGGETGEDARPEARGSSATSRSS